MIRASFIAIGIVAISIIAVGWHVCELRIHAMRAEERWPIVGEWPRYTLAQFDLPCPENVHFKTVDDVFLAGWFIPGSNGATVILVHGSDSTREEMVPHATYLHRAGFSVLLYDSRHRGQSGGSEITFAAKEPLDVKAAVDYLKRRSDVDSKRIGAQGISLGSASVIIAAAETPAIKGVVAESAFKDMSTAIAEGFTAETGWPSFPLAPVVKLIGELRLDADLDAVSPLKVIAKISPRSIFLIRDEKDTQLSEKSLNTLWAAAGEPKDKWIVPGAPHGKGWQTAPEEYERQVLEFWRRTFGIDEAEVSNSVGNASAKGVRTLLLGGAEMDAESKIPAETALIRAASQGQLDTVRARLVSGADVNAEDEDGFTALIAAAEKGQTEAVRVLVDGGADVNAKADLGATALIHAAWKGHTATVQALLDAGADVNVKDELGYTALAHAIADGHPDIVELLKKAGAKD